MVLAEVKVDNIYIVCGYTDMRKSIAGLSTIIVQQFEMRPDEHSMFTMHIILLRHIFGIRRFHPEVSYDSCLQSVNSMVEFR